MSLNVERVDGSNGKVQVTLVSFIKTGGNSRIKPEQAAQAFASKLMLLIFSDYQNKGEAALPLLLTSPTEIMKALNNHPKNTEYTFEAPASKAVLLRTLYANVFTDYSIAEIARLTKENLELKKFIAIQTSEENNTECWRKKGYTLYN